MLRRVLAQPFHVNLVSEHVLNLSTQNAACHRRTIKSLGAELEEYETADPPIEKRMAAASVGQGARTVSPSGLSTRR